MAANSITYAAIFMQTLDKKMTQLLTSSAMELNENLVKYNGGSEIKIPKMSMVGLADYSRETGFTAGAVTLSWETRQLTKDRGREFSIDAMDVDESNFVATAGNVMGEFQRTKVAPEIDAYRYSTIFGYANTALKTASYTLSDATIFEQLVGDIATVQDIVGESETMTIYMSYAAAKTLDLADKVVKRLDVGDFAMGGVNVKLKALDGIPIVRVPSARFKSAFTFGSDGYATTATSMGINWIIAVNRSLIAVSKQDKMRIFNPDTNQDADAYKLQYRRYHDLFITDNGVDGLFVSYTAIAAPALTATVAAATGTGNTSFTATATTGNTLGYILGAASPGVLYNELLTKYSTAVEPYVSGTAFAAAIGQVLTMLEVDTLGRIVKVKEVTLISADIT
jgi:hypothetical protein